MLADGDRVRRSTEYRFDGTYTVSRRVAETLKSYGRQVVRFLPLRLKRRLYFLWRQRSWLKLNAPASFNEKVNWRIVNDRRSLIAFTCDKLQAKEYAAARGVRGPATLWAGTDLSELPVIGLPRRWVLKPNHRSGLVYFGNGSANLEELSKVTKGWLDEECWHLYGEWAYSQARRCFIVEEWIGSLESGAPPDYKFFVMNGRAELVFVDSDRSAGCRRRLYTRDWQPLEVELYYPKGPIDPRPKNYDELLAAAESLGSDFDFIRVDLFNCDGEIYFGELTPYPGSGCSKFVPADFDTYLGKLWTLPIL